ncbi:MAG: hypothetical protein GY719_24560 [bacterium]|nr:hypothetical protein [bacterium]
MRRARLRAMATCAVAMVLGAALPIAAQNLEASPSQRIEVHAYTLKHQQVHEALNLVRPLLTARGSVEVQPGGNTLVVRETPAVLSRVSRLLEGFDHPPEDLRFDIRIIQAGPKRTGISPPEPGSQAGGGATDELPEELASRLREILRYDDYRVLAQAGVTSKEGQDVKYSLGQSYSVSFRSGTVMAGRRLKLEGFRIVKQVKNPANKGRQLEPRELFHATLNLWIDRPLSLVLSQDESRREALMVAISCQRESDGR